MSPVMVYDRAMTELVLEGEAVTAAVVTMVLAACADLRVSDAEVAKVKDIVVSRTSWADDATADALIATAHDRIRDISALSDDRPRLMAALTHIGEQIGSLPARTEVLQLAHEVAAVDGLDDDEQAGINMLIEAFGADAAKIRA